MKHSRQHSHCQSRQMPQVKTLHLCRAYSLLRRRGQKQTASNFGLGPGENSPDGQPSQCCFQSLGILEGPDLWIALTLPFVQIEPMCLNKAWYIKKTTQCALFVSPRNVEAAYQHCSITQQTRDDILSDVNYSTLVVNLW